MNYIINAVAWVINFLFSKKSRMLALLPLKLSLTALFILVASLYVSSILMFVYFLITLFNALFGWLFDVNNVTVSGSAYGISLSDIWNAFLIFLNASGLGPSILTASSLLVTLLSSYFAFALTKMVAKEVMKFLDSAFNVLEAYEQ